MKTEKDQERWARPERAWLDGGYDLERHYELVDAVIDAGYSRSVAHGVAGWVGDLALDREGPENLVTPWRYRKILAELEPPKRRPGQRAKAPSAAKPLRRRSQRGAAHLPTVTVLAVLGVVAALSGRPDVLALTPIILDDVETSAAAAERPLALAA